MHFALLSQRTVFICYWTIEGCRSAQVKRDQEACIVDTLECWGRGGGGVLNRYPPTPSTSITLSVNTVPNAKMHVPHHPLLLFITLLPLQHCAPLDAAVAVDSSSGVVATARPAFHGEPDFHHHHGSSVVHPGLPESNPAVPPKAQPVSPLPMMGHVDLDYHHVHGASRVEHEQPLLHLDADPERFYPLASGHAVASGPAMASGHAIASGPAMASGHAVASNPGGYFWPY
jgi:hypothetical protein